MSDNGDKLKQLCTYLRESDDLYQAVQAESKDTGLSVSDILRLSLNDRYRLQLARVGAFPDGIPTTP